MAVTEAPFSFRRVTALDGHFASGDFECFCFDRVRSPSEDERSWEQKDAERVYPDRLIPDEGRNQRGKWRITVEFEPEKAE